MMIRIFVIILITSFLRIEIACAGELYSLPDDPSKGQEIFIKKGCIQCHSIRGEGGNIGPDLGRKVFNLSLIQIAGEIWNHCSIMSQKMEELKIPWPKFEGNEMAELIAFLYYLNYFDEPGDAAAGKDIFSDKGCIKCHSIGGEGGKVGPSLDQLSQYASPVFIVQSMWNHCKEMVSRMRERGIEVPAFRNHEVVDLFAYIRTAGKSGKVERVYSSPGNPKNGERLFVSRNCIKCHSVNGEGGSIAPNLAKVEFQYSLTQIAGIMWNHLSKMWEKMEEMKIPPPVFSGDEMADVIAYMYSIHYSGEPGDAARGKELFSSKGCMRCHAVRGEGGDIGPDLGTSEWVKSPVITAQVMWNHAPIMAAKMKETNLPWPKFEGNEMADLFEYLKTR
jgi:mono/diheme cytochrome c family protein